MEFDLKGKVALVSGCSQGLGYACVLTLAKHGADIFGVSIGDDSQLKEEVTALGGNYASLHLSLTTPGAIHSVLKEALGTYGKIDILLNFASVLKKEETLSLSKLEWNSAMDVNISATFFLSQEVIKQFIKQGHGGKIINASGVLPLHTSEYCVYTTSKGAVDNMSKYLAYEFGQHNIQVNTIQFGFMTCGSSLQNGEGEEKDTSLLKEIPASRWGCYQDADGLILLLASSQSDYISGACIPVDGGYSIR